MPAGTHVVDTCFVEAKDKARATELLVAHSEAAREPAFNLQKARVYLAASDPEVGARTWRKALNTLVESKRAGSANRRRWGVFVKDKAIKPLLDLVILETRTDQLLGAVVRGKVSTNVYLRRLQTFCIGMNWLPWPILPPRMWAPIKFKKKGAIKQEEHLQWYFLRGFRKSPPANGNRRCTQARMFAPPST